MQITPLILGRGRAGDAISKSLVSLNLIHPEFEILKPVGLARGADLNRERKQYEHPLLCIANPHGLHAQALLEAAHAGFEAVICEKPVCVNQAELDQLRKIKMPVAVLHGYRQTWGMQKLKSMIVAKELGEMVTIEGRYWQSSAAERGLLNEGVSSSWKNSVKLSGEFDVFLDIATHWVDAVSFLQNNLPERIDGWKSYANAETPHRDSHVQLSLTYPQGHRGFGSISKNVHGASNHFEINVLGTLGSAHWQFLSPDEIRIGRGREQRIITRENSDLGSQQAPFHGLGWIEGYMEIAYCLIKDAFFGQTSEYPKLQSNLDLLEKMLQTKWQA